MKKVILLIVLSLSLTSCSLLNRVIDAPLGIPPYTCDDKGLCVQSFNKNFEFKVLDCIGDPVKQTVEVTVGLKNKMRNKLVSFSCNKSNYSYAYDDDKHIFEIKEIKFPNSKTSHTNYENFYSPTGVMLKGKIVFRNVLPSVKKFKKVSGYVTFQNEHINSLEEVKKSWYGIKNLKINWAK